MTFLAADRDSAESSAAVTVYTRKSGTVTDTLTLTNAGTSGRFTYQYVGGAFWQRVDQQTSTGNVSLDAAAYGIETLGPALPRTGTAAYAVDLVGLESTSANVSATTGSGKLQVDFAKGIVITQGTFQGVISGERLFHGEARLNTTSNGFSGSLAFDDFGMFTGTLVGRFYGPNAEELGATYEASQGSNRAVGVVIGRKDGSLSPNSDYSALTNDQIWATSSAKLSYDQGTSAPSAGSTKSEALVVYYNAALKTYTLIAPDRTVYFGDTFPSGGPEMMIPAAGGSEALTLYGGGLTFLRGVGWISEAGASEQLGFALLGQATPDSATPRLGQAAYKLMIAGAAADPRFSNRMDFNGPGSLTVNFATGALGLRGTLDYQEHYSLAGRQRMTATGTITGTGRLAAATDHFSGRVDVEGVGNYGGTFDGQFFGPAANEVGGTFAASDPAGGSLAGLFTGATDAAGGLAFEGLLGLSAPATFSGVAQQGVSVDQSDVTIDPTAGTTRFNVTNNMDVTWGPGDIIAAKSDPAQTYYERVDATQTTSGYIFKSGTSNAKLALSYVSFAEVDQDHRSTNFPAHYRYFIPFGTATSASLMPRLGKATYSGVVAGDGVVYGSGASPGFSTADAEIGGTSLLTADFASGQVGLDLTLTARDRAIASSPFTALGTFHYSAPLNGTTFIGDADQSAGTGRTFGQFYGPSADEFSATWYLQQQKSTEAYSIQGVTVGKKN